MTPRRLARCLRTVRMRVHFTSAEVENVFGREDSKY